MKACKDNFKGYSDFQLRHILNKDNVSVYDQVFQRKTEKILDPKVACGKHFYADLKIEYFGNGSPGGFPDVPEGDVQDEALFQCVKACIRHNRDFLPMVTYMEAAGQLNVLNLHALLGTAMKVTPGGKRNECTDFILDVMRFIIRVAHHESHMGSVQVARDHFDKALCRDLSVHRASQGSASTWWATRKSFAVLVLPVATTDTCMQEGVKASTIMTELRALVDSSQVGKLLASKTLRDAQRDVHMTVVQNTLDEIPVGALTLDVKGTNRKLFFTKCQEIGCSPTETHKAKDHAFKHLGVSFCIPVQSLLDQYNLAWECLVRTQAIDSGEFAGLFCEKELATDVGIKCPAPEEPLMTQTKMARAEMVKFLAGEDPTAKAINDKYKEKLGYLMGIDKYAKIEMAYFEASAGESGMTRAHDFIQKQLPSPAEVDKTPSSVLASFQAQVGHKLFVFAGSGAASIYKKVMTLVKAIHEGSRPCFEGATEAGFMKEVMSKLLNFARLEAPTGASEQGRSLIGKDAVQWQFQKVQGMTGKPSHADINMLSIYGWCLSKAENEQVSTWRKQAGGAQAKAPAPASSSAAEKETPVKAGTSRAKDKQQHLDDMTKLLFKR